MIAHCRFDHAFPAYGVPCYVIPSILPLIISNFHYWPRSPTLQIAVPVLRGTTQPLISHRFTTTGILLVTFVIDRIPHESFPLKKRARLLSD
jgi:hypothetical protein